MAKIIRHIESLQKTSKAIISRRIFQKQIASIKKKIPSYFFDIDYHRDLKIIKTPSAAQNLPFP